MSRAAARFGPHAPSSRPSPFPGEGHREGFVPVLRAKDCAIGGPVVVATLGERRMDSDDRRLRLQSAVLQLAREHRRPLTPTEGRLWVRLRGRQLAGYKFRRQHVVGRFIADFACIERKLIVELDGESHEMRGEYDAERTEWLELQG